MGFDGCVVPEALRPYVDWVTGMAWPEGDPEKCFRIADACVAAAHRLTADTGAADLVTAGLVGDRWDGAAQQAFAARVRVRVGGRRADLVETLIETAVAYNGVGVTIQYAQRMITFIVITLLATLPLLILNAPWMLRSYLQVARMSALQIARMTLTLVGFFAAFGGGLDWLTQYSQVRGGRRDGIDREQLLLAVRDGAINGALTGLLGGALGRLATPALRAGIAREEAVFREKMLALLTRTAPGQALQYGVAGSATTAVSLTLDGRPLDWRLILTSGTSAALGADGQHLATPGLTGSPPGRGTALAGTADPDGAVPGRTSEPPGPVDQSPSRTGPGQARPEPPPPAAAPEAGLRPDGRFPPPATDPAARPSSLTGTARPASAETSGGAPVVRPPEGGGPEAARGGTGPEPSPPVRRPRGDVVADHRPRRALVLARPPSPGRPGRNPCPPARDPRPPAMREP
ncbi:hypothetical protein ACQEUU_21515 [Nonomuraea sp. CA-218870]|uniref:WXG100-like domain-containing protein n=1 Tax=Nonomuraea sp. CA-218870 TaxID=3239998 RepID=UPI003D927282